MAFDVYTIERIEALYKQAKAKLNAYPNVQLRYGDGRLGWPEAAPFDGIIITAAIKDMPSVWLEQLADGGRLVCPLGQDYSQQLQCITRQGDKYHTKVMDNVIFVPCLYGLEGDKPDE